MAGLAVPMERMSADTHRQIGAALGYPLCCVKEWIADPYHAAIRRGGVWRGLRTSRPEGLPDAWMRDAEGIDTLVGTVSVYVPCTACSGPHTEGWGPWGA